MKYFLLLSWCSSLWATELLSIPQGYIETISVVRKPLRDAVFAAERATSSMKYRSASYTFDATHFRGVVAGEFEKRLGNAKFSSYPGPRGVLILDTPLIDNSGYSLNRPGVTLVVDHHAEYWPSEALENTQTQILSRFKASVQKEAICVRAINRFHQELTGNVKAVLYSSDNIGDSGEVIAFLTNGELQKRLCEDPNLIEILIESGRFTDFHVFRGKWYESKNTGERSERAIQLSKAIMHTYGRLLREARIAFGDRIEALEGVAAQRWLLEAATRESEQLTLEATIPGYSVKHSGRVALLARQFDEWRGGPGMLKSPGLTVSSYEIAVANHKLFNDSLRGDLTGVISAAILESRVQAILRNVFGYAPISTGHQFADWSAPSIANDENPSGALPISIEIGGQLPSDRGRPVIVAKASERLVNLIPLANALNEKARQIHQNPVALVRFPASQQKGWDEFTQRSGELVFSFGGHSLSRAEILATIAETLATQLPQILP